MNSINEIRHDTSDPKKLRSFAIMWCVIFLMCAGVIWFKHATLSKPCVGSAVVWIGLALACPRWILGPLYFAWMLLGLGIGAVVSRVILTILFFCLFTPMAIVIRLIRGDFLDIGKARIQPAPKSSYWKEIDPEKPSEYHRQY